MLYPGNDPVIRQDTGRSTQRRQRSAGSHSIGRLPCHLNDNPSAQLLQFSVPFLRERTLKRQYSDLCADRWAGVPGTTAHPAKRKTGLKSRPGANRTSTDSPFRLRKSKPAMTGAVRLSEPKPVGTVKRASIAAMIVAGAAGVLATSSSTGNVNGGFKTLVMTSAPTAIPLPTFRFDDADSIIENQLKTAQHSHQVNSAGSRPPGAIGFSTQALIGTPASHRALHSSETAVEEIIPDTLAYDAEDEVDVTTADNSQLAATDSALTVAMVSPPTDSLAPLERILPSQTLTPAVSLDSLPGESTRTITVKPGDTLSGLLNDNGISNAGLKTILADALVQEHLNTLRVKDKLDFEYGIDGTLNSVSMKVNRDTRIRISQVQPDQFVTESIKLPLEYERVVTSGTIQQSLYLAAEKANLKQSTIMELSDIFEWELDFARDIRKGDSFSIVYDRLYREGKYIGDGDILAAEFIRGNTAYRAIRFTDDNGHTDYYTPNGDSKRRAFMRHPVDVVRITSKFDPNRLHPVLHKIRAHKGVDYGAPHGSPIYATADGVVQTAGTKGAYGKTVILKHGENRTTLYAHMSRIAKKSRVGTKVKRGDVIGYVGKTGRVTGTHLHYEFRIAGKHVDPLKVKLPNAPRLDKQYHARLRAISNELLAQMRSVVPTQKVASR